MEPRKSISKNPIQYELDFDGKGDKEEYSPFSYKISWTKTGASTGFPTGTLNSIYGYTGGTMKYTFNVRTGEIKVVNNQG